jgi:hypothetical protein
MIAVQGDLDYEFKLSKRELKRRLKVQQAMNKDLALRIKVNQVKKTTGATDNQLCKRFKKSLYWIQQATGRTHKRKLAVN